MTPNEKYTALYEQLLDADMAAVNMLTNYNGMNHDVLDYLADEFGIEWEEDEEN